jgi:hypothetical protein
MWATGWNAAVLATSTITPWRREVPGRRGGGGAGDDGEDAQDAGAGGELAQRLIDRRAPVMRAVTARHPGEGAGPLRR